MLICLRRRLRKSLRRSSLPAAPHFPAVTDLALLLSPFAALPPFLLALHLEHADATLSPSRSLLAPSPSLPIFSSPPCPFV